MKYIAVLLLAIFAAKFSVWAQNNSVAQYRQYANFIHGRLLVSSFPVWDIREISVCNFKHTRKLNATELMYLKFQLALAVAPRGLLIKPNYPYLLIKMNDECYARPGIVYGSAGAVHFEGASNSQGYRFSGSFFLPVQLNLNNY